MSPSQNPGVLPPLGEISQINQSGLILIMTALSMSFVLVSFSIRVHVRRSNGPWKTDDNLIAAATFISCIQSAVVFFEVHKGLGKADSLVERPHLFERQKAYYANNLLYIVVLFLSKASIGALYLRLTPVDRHVVAIWTILAASAVWMVMSILLVTIECSWHSTCAHSFARWMVIGLIESVIEISQVLMAWYIVRKLRISTNRKTLIVGAFATRLLVIPALALRLYYINPSTLSSNRTMALSLLVVCTQLQLGYGVMAASIPCLAPFVAVYEKSISGVTSNRYYVTRSGNPNGSGTDRSVRLKTLRPTFTRRSHSRTSITGPLSPTAVLRTDIEDSSYTATVSGRDRKSKNRDRDAISEHSQDSRRMIIEQKTDWSVQYDSGSLASGEYTHAL